MKQKQLITAVLSLCMVTNMCGTVFADNVTYEEKRGTPVTISLENGEDLTANEFVVKVPKKVRASKNENVNYTVTVSGKLKDGNVLHVIPNGVVKLTSGDSDIVLESKVTQDKTDFDSEELEAYDEVVTDGSVGVVERTDGGDIDEVKGSYSGNMVFNISVDDGTTTEVVKFGLFDDNGNVIKSWDDIISEGYYEVVDGVLDDTDYQWREENGIRLQDLYGNLIIPDDIGITAINGYTFNMTYDDNDIGIKSIVIPDGVTTIGDSAFGWNNRLESVIMPDTVTEMATSSDGHTFYNTTKLKSVRLSNNLKNIPDQAFSGCTSLESITIPDSVTDLGNYAFAGCKNLKSVNIPKNLTSALMPFSDCTNLKHVVIPDGMTKICNYLFYESGLESITIPNSVTTIGNSAFCNCKSLASVTIPDSVTIIDEYAFSCCTALSSFYIPDTVTTIGNEAFELVPSVQYDGAATGSPWGALAFNKYVDGDFVYTDSTKTNLLAYVGSSATAAVPDTVTTIGAYAFYDHSCLTSITIPDSVTSTGEYAFACSKNLERVTLGNVKSISDHAFYNCSNLTVIDIPDSVTNIDSGAFNGCTNLKSITLPDSVTSIGNIMGSSVFGKCSSLTAIDIPDGITNIYPYTFSGCSSLTTVTIPSSVKSIYYQAFEDCKNLTSVTIPEGVTRIQTKTFNGCSSLTTVTIPSSVTYIDNMAFSNCKSLTSITIPDSVTVINNYAFKNVPHIYYNGTATGSPWGAEAMN